MTTIANLQQNAANTQVAEIQPLMSLRLPSSQKDSERDVFRFQVNGKEPVTFGGYTFEFLDARVDNVSGSQTPYSPYTYRIAINNNHTGGNVNVNEKRITTSFTSIREFIASHDGLRNASFHIYYNHPGRERLNREAVYRINSSTVGIRSIILNLIAPFETIIPSHIV
jgi:hypothetical protein